MADSTDGQERLLKQLVSSFRCSYCRHVFEREQVRVTARKDELWIVSVRCGRCRNQQIFWVALKDEEDATPTDVSAAEAERFAGMPPISTDDVLDMHVALRHFDGDFERLFRE
jgi:hypothetical protein